MTSPTPQSPDAAGNLGLFWLPIAWVIIVMVLSVQFLWQAWPALNDYRLPPAAELLIEAEMAAAAITLFAGLFVLALGLGRSRLFPWAFALWLGFDIVAMAASTAYALSQPDFQTPLLTYVILLVRTLVGLGCIYLIFRSPQRGSVFAARTGQGMPVFARIICCVLGVLVGGFIGFWVGLGIGIGISEWTDMSCFEGACGFFAFFTGLAGVVVGAIAGGIGVGLWTRRRAA